ncbi:MAG: hypothetical protein RIC16_08425 [Rhodospirillales bacterium]
MRTLSLVFIVSVLAVLPVAADEMRLDNDEIREMLTGRTAVYDGGVIRQYFSENGRTPYWDGKRMTMGSWQATGNRYCSAWPPSTGVSCYDMYRTEDGKAVWVGERGDRYVATMDDGNLMPDQ